MKYVVFKQFMIVKKQKCLKPSNGSKYCSILLETLLKLKQKSIYWKTYQSNEILISQGI